MELIKARACDMERVLSLYDACRNRPGSHWRDEYPARDNIEEDIKNGGLYLLMDGQTPAGAVSVVPTDETDGLVSWRASDRPCEISRVCLAPVYQGKGLSNLLIDGALKKAADEGYTSARLLVALDVLPARRAYARAGFVSAGTVYMELWNHSWYDCMERAL